ncbi:Firmicu-CTERM sorting domain-containing protein [Levilactobacillus lanxiensis]|uniref:Firmicu-CTERM sorting domain-containing protein n=1 Tax=Levilactobacillus lanxiensis TaxID=2799568 RepID=A0ABW4D2Z6_9LACO|nr:Firmicu-CTERM sorting domain-containing protein [Levilactobacillus lanxiensis]
MKLWKLMMAGVVALGLAGAVVTAEPATVTAQASDNITIDGKFSDWDNANLTDSYNGSTAMESNGQYIDVYVKMQNGQVPGYGDYNFTIDGKNYFVWSDNIPGSVAKGESKAVTFTGGTTNEGPQYGTVATGYVSNDGEHPLAEFRVDLSKFGLTDSANGKKVEMTNPNIGGTATTTVDDLGSKKVSPDVTATSGVIDGKADSSSKATTTTDNDANNDNDNLNIKIDGKFADWKNVTLTEGYNGYTAMVTDGDKVYVYVKMKYGMVPGYGDYNFEFNGKKIFVFSKDIPYNPVSHGSATKVTFRAGNYNEDTSDSSYGTVGDGYVSSDSEGHSIAEFQIDVSKLKLSSMTGQTITMYNPNIGKEKVTVAGGSTGPYVIAGIGVLIAGFGYWRLRKSGKLKRRQNDAADK